MFSFAGPLPGSVAPSVGTTVLPAPSVPAISFHTPVTTYPKDFFPGVSAASHVDGAVTRTTNPIVTGTSVLGILYKDGVMLTADCLGSYGSLARFRDMRRLKQVGNHTIVGASGDLSDFQHISHMLDDLVIEDYYTEDDHHMAPENIYEYLSRVMYARRTKMNPLWNKIVVAGYRNSKRFLGYVDLLGTTYHSSVIATGYGAHIAIPLLRKAVEGREDTLTEQDAQKILDDAMRVLYYRDARSLNKLQRATVGKDGIKITEPYSLETDWSFGADIKGYGGSG